MTAVGLEALFMPRAGCAVPFLAGYISMMIPEADAVGLLTSATGGSLRHLPFDALEMVSRHE